MVVGLLSIAATLIAIIAVFVIVVLARLAIERVSGANFWALKQKYFKRGGDALLRRLSEVQKDPNATTPQTVERFRHLYALNPDEWELKDVYAERWVENGEKKPEPAEDKSNFGKENVYEMLKWLRSTNDNAVCLRGGLGDDPFVLTPVALDQDSPLSTEMSDVSFYSTPSGITPYAPPRKSRTDGMRPIRVTFEASELPAYFEFKEEVQEQKRQAALQEKEKADRKKAAELQVAQAETTELLAKVAQEEIDALFAKSEEQINEARRITEQVAANMKGE